MRQCGDGTTDEQRRFRFEKVSVLLATVAPICFRDANVLQHRFRAEKAGRDRDGRHTVRLQLGRHVERETFQRELDALRQRVSSSGENIVLGHLDDQAAVQADHHRHGMLGGDDVRKERLPEDGLAVFQVRLPERVPLSHHRLFARNAVHQYIQPAMLAIDPAEESLDF